MRFRKYWLSRNKTKPRQFPHPCPRVSILTRWQSCVLTVAPSLRRQLRSRRRSPCPQVALAPSWHPLQPADTTRRLSLCSHIFLTQRVGSPPPNAAHPKPNNNPYIINLLLKPSKSGRTNSRLCTQTSLEQNQYLRVHRKLLNADKVYQLNPVGAFTRVNCLK